MKSAADKMNHFIRLQGMNSEIGIPQKESFFSSVKMSYPEIYEKIKDMSYEDANRIFSEKCWEE